VAQRIEQATDQRGLACTEVARQRDQQRGRWLGCEQGLSEAGTEVSHLLGAARDAFDAAHGFTQARS
jgi:hypothetical protein